MTTLRPMTCLDLLKFNIVNLDSLTETYGIGYYLQYIARWPEYCIVAEAPDGSIMGYIIGKSEGRGENWHGHVTALSIAPSYRRLGVAKLLLDMLEQVSESKRCYFVDLFVRASNTAAIAMYHKLGYSIYRQVINYYTGQDSDEDALDMRKALSADVESKSIVPLPHPVHPDEVD